MRDTPIADPKKLELIRALRSHQLAVSTQSWARNSQNRLRRQMHIADSLADALSLTMVSRRFHNN